MTTSTRPVPPVTGTPRRAGAARVTRTAFRVVVTVHAAAVLAQPVLAGRFLNGDFGMLSAHRVTGIAVGLLGMVQLAVALAHRWAGRGPWRPALICLGLSLAELAQIFLGFNRFVGVHVPLGVAIVAVTLLVATSAWRTA